LTDLSGKVALVTGGSGGSARSELTSPIRRRRLVWSRM